MEGGLGTSVFTAAQAAAIIRKAPVALFAGAAALAGLAAPVVAVDEIGSTSVIVETVTGESAGEVRRLVLKDNVYRDEVIEASIASAAEITFLDDTKLLLGPNTRLTLDRFVFDPDPALGKFVMTASKGVFRFVSGSLSKEAYVLRTPTATIGVRGTALAMVIRADGTTVVIDTRGCLLWRRKDIDVKSNVSDEVLTLDRCRYSTTVSPDGTMAPQGPPPDWAVALLEELDDLVSQPGGAATDNDAEDVDAEDVDESGQGTQGGEDGGNGNRSGLGDDTNPGEGEGRDNSSNEGSDNPGGGGSDGGDDGDGGGGGGGGHGGGGGKGD